MNDIRRHINLIENINRELAEDDGGGPIVAGSLGTQLIAKLYAAAEAQGGCLASVSDSIGKLVSVASKKKMSGIVFYFKRLVSNGKERIQASRRIREMSLNPTMPLQKTNAIYILNEIEKLAVGKLEIKICELPPEQKAKMKSKIPPREERIKNDQ